MQRFGPAGYLFTNSSPLNITFVQETMTLAEWLASLDNLHIQRSQINQMIMEYLVLEGYKGAAEKFKLEAGFDSMPSVDGNDPIDGDDVSKSSFDERIRIREAIEEGKINHALFLINHFYPELIDQNRDLYFRLQQQQLIELIREQKTAEALSFAQEQLSVDEEYLDLVELERTLALLAFDKPENSPYADLMGTAHRQQLASQVNEVILKEQSGSAEFVKPKFATLIKLLLWTQNDLEKKKAKYPKITDLSNAVIAPPNDD